MSEPTPRRWRSRSGMLLEGATDGKYKKVVPNWNTFPGSGVQETAASRSDLNSQNGFSFLESSKKHAPGQWKS